MILLLLNFTLHIFLLAELGFLGFFIIAFNTVPFNCGFLSNEGRLFFFMAALRCVNIFFIFLVYEGESVLAVLPAGTPTTRFPASAGNPHEIGRIRGRVKIRDKKGFVKLGQGSVRTSQWQ